MVTRIRTIMLAAALLSACGEEEPTKKKTVVVEEPKPEDAVAEMKLQKEEYRDFYFCADPYPQTCKNFPSQVKQAYVLERETDEEPFKLVLFNNQDPKSTWAEFIYLTIDMDDKAITEEGTFKYREFAGATEKQGTPLWGIPE